MTRNGRFWTAAQTRWGQERRAAHHVERQNFKFYLPEIINSHGDSQRRELLFPGYIFVQIDLRRLWAVLASTRGISRLLMDGELPCRMPRGCVEEIQSREVAGYVRLEPKFPQGSAVRVSDEESPLFGLHGIVSSTSRAGRCAVLLTLMGRGVKKEMLETELSAA